MRVVLVNPPFTLEECFRRFAKAGSLQQPLGLAYIAAILEKAGYDVKIVDAPALKLNLYQTVKVVAGLAPDVVGLTSTTPNFSRCVYLAKNLKKIFDVPIVIGGAHPTALPVETLAYNCFDIVVLGEGEYTMLELVEHLESGRTLTEVNGIAFRERGKVVKTSPRPYIEDLDRLPFPARHLLPPLRCYRPTPSAYRSLPQATLITSRGCPYSCIFCDRSVFGNRYRARSAANVVDEIEEVVRRYGAKEVRFWDDTFNIDRKRVLAICSEIRRRKLDVDWSCLCRANLVDEMMLHEMARAGCWQIDYGIESGSSELLRRIGKGLTLEQIRSAVEKTKAAGIKVRGFFMLGLPGETEETLNQTIEFAKTLKLDVAIFHITVPFPGTDLYLAAVASGEISSSLNYQHFLIFGSEELPYVPKGLSKEIILRYRSKAYKSFYLRPNYILGQLAAVRSVRDFYRYVYGAVTVGSID